MHHLAGTVEAWWAAVEAAITTGYSNAHSRGYNRPAKHEGRNASASATPINQRRHIRWTCIRQHRRATAKIAEVPSQVR